MFGHEGISKHPKVRQKDIRFLLREMLDSHTYTKLVISFLDWLRYCQDGYCYKVVNIKFGTVVDFI